MNRTLLGLASTLLVAPAFVLLGARSAPASPATPDSDTGCFVTDAAGGNHFDSECQTHTVLRRDASGAVVLLMYQDQGQLPADAPHPDSTLTSTFEQCLNLGVDGVICGTVFEVITPAGEYKSSFRME